MKQFNSFKTTIKKQYKLKRSFLFATILLIGSSVALLSNSSGPASAGNGGQTGAPGEGNCSNCHGGGAFTPSVVISLFDAGTTNPVTSYVGGTTYDVQVMVSSTTGSPQFGFQLTTLNSSNTMAGGYSLPSSNAKITSLGARDYLEHNAISASGTFMAQWTAPTSGTGAVTFYAYGNCVNGTGGTSGDNAAGTSLSITETACIPTASTINDTICSGNSYTFNGIAQTTAGSYLDTLVNAGGCDSVITLNLTVNTTPVAPTVTTDSVCAPGGIVNLSATGFNVQWFDQMLGGNLVNTGNTYSPNILADSTYYVTQEGGISGNAVMPSQTGAFSGNTRGYWFTAPSNFTITSLQVPTTASSGTQNIAVLKFTGNTPPPTFSSTTNAFTTLFITQNNLTAGNISVNIPIQAGEVIGIMGVRDDVNSYSNTGNTTIIDGNTVALTRMGMQFPLATTLPQDIWSENGGNISRIEFEYSTANGCFSTPRTPLVAKVNSFAAEAPAPELLYYNFNGSGTTVPNLATNPPVGTATATILGSITQGSSGKSGGALIGSGIASSSDYLNTGYATNLTGTSWTISFWSKDFGSTSPLYYIFGDVNANSFRCFTNGVAGPNNWILRATGMTDVYINGGATTAPTLNTFVYDITLNNIKAYKNGILVNTVSQGPLTIASAGPFKVMGYNSNVGAPVNGLLDEFRLYNRALSDAEVLALLNTNTVIARSTPASPAIICAGNNVSLNANDLQGNITYSWMPGTLAGDTVNINPTTTSDYTVTATDANGCTLTSSVNVAVVNTTLLAQATAGNAASTTGSANQTFVQNDGISNTYTDASCNTIATINDGAGGNVLGSTISTVEVDASVQTFNTQPYVRRHYTITPTNQGAATVTLYLTQADFDDYNANNGTYLDLPTGPTDATGIANVRITKVDGALGVGVATVITPMLTWDATNMYWVAEFPVTSFSSFYFHTVNPANAPLPVTLLSFTGKKEASTNVLNWITSMEQNNAFFNIQKSTDARNFTTIAKVNTKAINGNSSVNINYDVIDENPATGHNYYRLQQTDKDGRMSNSQVLDLYRDANGNVVNVYPNPTSSLLNVECSLLNEGRITIKLSDLSGRVIKEINTTNAISQIDMNILSVGIYQLQVLQNKNILSTQKVEKK